MNVARTGTESPATGWGQRAHAGVQAAQLREALRARGLADEGYRRDVDHWVWAMAADLRLTQCHATGPVNARGQAIARTWMPVAFADIAVRACRAHPGLSYGELRAKLGPVAAKLGGRAF